MTTRIEAYELITYLTRCCCGHESSHDELLAVIYKGSGTFGWTLVKPGEPLYDLDFRRETRRVSTRACLQCFESTPKSTVAAMREAYAVVGSPRQLPPAKPGAIDIEELDFS